QLESLHAGHHVRQCHEEAYTARGELTDLIQIEGARVHHIGNAKYDRRGGAAIQVAMEDVHVPETQPGSQQCLQQIHASELAIRLRHDVDHQNFIVIGHAG